MQKDPLVKGHPIHAALSDFPIGLTGAVVACDLLSAVTHRHVWRVAARSLLRMALVSGSLAALVGWWDYRAVPPEHPARRVGAWHGWLNAATLGLLLLSYGIRGQGPVRRLGGLDARRLEKTAPWLARGAFLGLVVSGWLGGELVFRLGWRVVRAEHAEQLEAELRARGEGQRITEAHRVVQDYEQTHALLP